MSEWQPLYLDMAMLHHHGSEETEYLNGWPKAVNYPQQIDLIKRYMRERIRRSENKPPAEITKVKKEYQEKYGIPQSWSEGAMDPEVRKEDSLWSANLDLVVEDFGIYYYKPNVRFAIFDACYNGSFHAKQYIAGSYIFGEGRTIAAQGNTVNSLQDKWPQEMIGLLSLGMRVGEWNKMTCYLETHIIGDPTFGFASADPSIDVQGLSVQEANNNKSWLNLLDCPYPDVQALALRKLYNNQYENISALLLETYKTSKLGSVRAECLKLSASLADENFPKVLALALTDDYELVQRFAVSMAGDSGDDELIPVLVKLGFENLPERVVFNYGNIIQFFDWQNFCLNLKNSQGKMNSWQTRKLPCLRSGRYTRKQMTGTIMCTRQ